MTSTPHLILELWIFTGMVCFLVFEIGSFHNQFPDYMEVIWILIGFGGVGTLGALKL